MKKLKIILGPCQIESHDHTRLMVEGILEAVEGLNVDLYYKSSFDKANRSSISGKRGVGIDNGVEILSSIREEYKIKTLTDVHETWQPNLLVGAVDVLQIPAFLSRQTDLLIAAANTGLKVNVKKGQFMAPYDMKNVLEKIPDNEVWLTERGTTFGYNNLVVDYRGLVIMKSFGSPVIFDATHSVQLPGANGNSSGGERQFIEPLSKAALAVGVDGLFMETHNDPENAPSDAATQVPLNELRDMLRRIIND